MEFQDFGKITRLSNQTCVITEKIDGTNAQVYICQTEHNTISDFGGIARYIDEEDRAFTMFAGSRNRYITPDNDNYGFAKYCVSNQEELFKLGPGRHFGEYWGLGIQRGYNLEEKRFSLFNNHRWESERAGRPSCCSVVPVLARVQLNSLNESVNDTMDRLKDEGSLAAPGYDKPEGIIIYLPHVDILYKKTFDDKHKMSLVL